MDPQLSAGKLLASSSAAAAAASARATREFIPAYDDPDVDLVELPAALVASSTWGSGHQKRKRRQVVPNEVIDLDEEDDLDAVIFVSETSSDHKSKLSLGFTADRQKHVKNTPGSDIAGPSTDSLSSASNSKKAGSLLDVLKGGYDPGPLGYNMMAECEFEDYADEDEEYDDEYDFDDSLLENDSNFNLAAKFDDLDFPPGVEAPLSWLQRSGFDRQKSKQIKFIDEAIDEKYALFKQFDTATDHTDHHFSRPEAYQQVKKPSKDWVKRIQNELKVLEKDLPESIFVRMYEGRMDLLRAVIIGPPGTPYHDGLFFFDVFFPPEYPNKPPKVHYRSGGLRLNPNLYACGKVCLSLLNTWSGKGCELWLPAKSTMLQVLVSIQALVLNAKPYFNEPGYANLANTAHGEKESLAYNEEAFLLSCKTMLYSLRNPPKNFEDFIAGHFRKRGQNILFACKAYMEGAQVGCVVGKGIQDVDEGDKSCSAQFRRSLKKLFEDLLMEFTVKGADCDEFLAQKVKDGAAASHAADTNLRL